MNAQIQQVWVAIKFQDKLTYCEIDLKNLSRDSFLHDVASVVPKALNSSHFDITIYDDRNATIPIHGLMNIIRTRIHFAKFHLRVEIGKVDRTSDEAKEIRRYLVADNLKHLAVKGVEENMSNEDIIELISSTGRFLFLKYGSDPNPEDKKSVIKSLSELFGNVDQNLLDKKMLQWIKNRRRPLKIAKTKKNGDRVKVRAKIKANEQNGSIVVESALVTQKHNDMLKVDEIPLDLVCEVDYLDYQKVEDENLRLSNEEDDEMIANGIVVESDINDEYEEYIIS